MSVPTQQPPAYAPPHRAGAPTSMVPQRIGDVLVVPHNYPLIGACVKCGATPADLRRVAVVRWVAPWVWATMLLSWLITVAAYYATRKTSMHDVSLCAACAREWDASQTEQQIAGLATIGALVGGTALALSPTAPVGVVIGLLLGGPIIGIAGHVVAGRKRLRARLIDEHGAHLLGVSPPASPPPPRSFPLPPSS